MSNDIEGLGVSPIIVKDAGFSNKIKVYDGNGPIDDSAENREVQRNRVVSYHRDLKTRADEITVLDANNEIISDPDRRNNLILKQILYVARLLPKIDTQPQRAVSNILRGEGIKFSRYEQELRDDSGDPISLGEFDHSRISIHVADEGS